MTTVANAKKKAELMEKVNEHSIIMLDDETGEHSVNAKAFLSNALDEMEKEVIEKIKEFLASRLMIDAFVQSAAGDGTGKDIKINYQTIVEQLIDKLQQKGTR